MSAGIWKPWPFRCVRWSAGPWILLLAQNDSAHAGAYQYVLGVGDLVDGYAAQLADGFVDVVDAVDVGLA